MSNFGIPQESLDADRNEFSARLQSLRLDRAARVSAALAEEKSAEALGEARQLSEKLGHPLAGVLADLDQARRESQRRVVAAPSLERDFPTLAMKIDQDFDFASITRDDLGNLQSTENALGWVGRSFDNS